MRHCSLSVLRTPIFVEDVRVVPTLAMSAAVLAASAALAGRLDQARRTMDDVVSLDPSLRLSTLDAWLPFHRHEDLALFAEGLKLAGLPE